MRYLIFENDCFLAAKKNNEDATNYLETLHEIGIIGKMVSFTEIFKECKTIDEQICKALRLMGIDDESYERNCKVFSVSIYGNWRHSHLFANNVLQTLFKCNLISEQITGRTNSDWYESVHTFCM